MFKVILLITLVLPKVPEPIRFEDEMASISECNLTVWEMTNRAPAELKQGGSLTVGCVIIVPRSENP